MAQNCSAFTDISQGETAFSKKVLYRKASVFYFRFLLMRIRADGLFPLATNAEEKKERRPESFVSKGGGGGLDLP